MNCISCLCFKNIAHLLELDEYNFSADFKEVAFRWLKVEGSATNTVILGHICYPSAQYNRSVSYVLFCFVLFLNFTFAFFFIPSLDEAGKK